MKNPQILAAVLLIVGLGAGFFGGMQYQKSQRSSGFIQSGGPGGQNGAGRRFGGGAGGNGGRVVGQIISSDSNSITVKLQDGSSKIVVVPASAAINKAAQGSKADLTTGTTVAVFGTSNSDGSVTASNVQINPMMRPGGESPRPSSSPSASGY
jgi:hypothetical protein